MINSSNEWGTNPSKSHKRSYPLHGSKSVKLPYENQPVSTYFGELTSGLGHMRERLSKSAYSDLIRSLEHRKKISPSTAEAIAQAVKDWAVSSGATHFCHWFQPLTGLTAEKHDAFITIQNSNHSELTVIERFSGDQLIKGEPDASSFPNGGMRSTFEARGYTAWDPNSPIFIVEDSGSRTLCIPSIFFGYHGQALDHKTPLLRSVEVLSQEVSKFLKLLGDIDVKSIQATLGAEQEYFLIDKKLAKKRPDLTITGRTLIGAPSARGQKLEDHYFSSIPPRVKLFMEDLGQELYRLGVPVKTRHNEVAPSQFEMAPIFEDMSISADHNTLVMDTLKRIAARHDFLCLLHEKPFAELNGSGKHCNWSIRNDKGENLLEPGHTPHQNIRFLAVIATVIKAVHIHADALAAAISSPGNDHRLGGNEAPPTIISVFLGSLLDNIYESIEKGEAAKATDEQILNLGVAHIPNISKDYTDRNRTSPFAFTGNKFEFRAVGSSTNVAVPMSILNAAVANAFSQNSEKLEVLLKKHNSRDEAVMELIKSTIIDHKDILFAGNNYSKEWREEATKRGLPIIDTCDDGFRILRDPNKTAFLTDLNVLSKAEVESRYNINMERMITSLGIEHQVLLELVNDFVCPAIEKQLIRSQQIIDQCSSKKLKETLSKKNKKLEDYYADIIQSSNDLNSQLIKLDSNEDLHEDFDKKVDILKSKITPIAVKLRAAADASELMVADELWQLPKYRDLLFN